MQQKSDGLVRAYMHLYWSKPEVFLGCGWGGWVGGGWWCWDSRLSQQNWWTKLPGMTSISYSVFRSYKEHDFIKDYNDFVVVACKWNALLAKQIWWYSLHGLSWRWRQHIPWLENIWALHHWLVVGYWHFTTTYQFHLQGSSSPRRLVGSYWCFRIAHQSWDW